MFMTQLLISGLKKQDVLLEELIQHLESKPKLDPEDCSLYSEMTGKVAKNLKSLRRIKGQYVSFINHETLLQKKTLEDHDVQFFENWLIRSGVSPKSNLTVNQIGLYTDFT